MTGAFEECGDLRFFQPSLINGIKAFFSSVLEEFFIGFQKDLLFPEQENKILSIQNSALRLHEPRLHVENTFKRRENEPKTKGKLF